MYNFGVCNLESHINSSQVGPVLAKYSMQFKAEGFLFFFLERWMGGAKKPSTMRTYFHIFQFDAWFYS
jgi:hypothetical protein